MSTSEPLLEAALGWAARGIPVLPVKPGGKAPLTRHGLHDATTDAALLRRWWARWPDANVAIATGAPSVDVLDVDVRGASSGWPALGELRDAAMVPDGAPLVRTPSGGAHLYFIGTGQRNGSLPDLHLDFRSTGGYVLVPPSRIVSPSYEGTYRWERAGEPTASLDWQAVVAALRPPEPVRSIRPKPAARRGWDVHTLAAAVAREREGNRNRLLYWAFCEALRSGYEDLRPIAEAGLRCGQTVQEVEATWRSAIRRVTGDGQTRQSPSPAEPALTRSATSRGPAQ